MYKSYKYKLYPTRQQAIALATMLEAHRHLYNHALAERKGAWEQERRNVFYGEQSAHLRTDRLMNPYLAATNFSSCQATLRRLDKAFQAFFRRLKTGETPGYPRFKGPNRFHTVEYPSYGDGCKIIGSRIYFQHIGRVRFKLHRPLAGTIKTVSFTREADGWHVIFLCDFGDVVPPRNHGPAVGIDLGLKAFLVTSEEEIVAAPKFYRKAEQALRRAHRRVTRRQKGSNRRVKAITALSRAYLHIYNQRRNFHHHIARSLVTRYGTIVHEHLNVKGIARSYLAKSTLDAGWSSFLSILRYKAVEAGCVVIAVPAAQTTQMCSRCGTLPATLKTLSDRMHTCITCGYTTDRDHNAALNILRLGLSHQALTLPEGEVV